MLSTLSICLLLIAPTSAQEAEDEEIAVATTVLNVPGTELEVNVPAPPEDEPQPWGWTINDSTMDVRLGMRNADAYASLVFTATDYQLDIEQVDPAEFMALFEDPDDEDTVYTWGEPERFEDEELGPMLRVPAQVRDNWMERDLWVQLEAFSVESSSIVIMATGSESAEGVALVMDQVREMLAPTTPALTREELPYGRYVAEAGYELDLPMGWRALTEKEMRSYSSSRIAGEGPFAGMLAASRFVDPTTLDGPVFGCTADAGSTLHIIDPAKSDEASENFKTFARVVLKGGRYRVVTGTDEEVVDVLGDSPFYVEEEGELEFLDLGDREAYLWEADGQVYQEPASAAIFYTTYADLQLHCVSMVPADQREILGTFEQTVRGLRITDGEQHGMPLSLQARYVRWWPTGNPFLQLYWFPLPIALVAGWLMLRSDD